MAYEKKNYYAEGLADSFAEHGITATAEQIDLVAADVANYAEHESQAFYSPSWSDRISDIEGEWKKKYAALQKEMDAYRDNAETAIKRALRQYDDASVSIGEHGEVTRYDGRITIIQ